MISPILAKLLLPLIAPLGWSAGLWLLGAVLYWRGRRQGAVWCMVLGIALLLAMSSPLVGERLLGALEREYPTVAVDASPTAEGIVVLGGVTVPPVAPRQEVEASGGIDRLLHGMRLYRAEKAPVLIFSGGILTLLTGSSMSEAEQFLQLATAIGIDSAAVILEGRSRNTHENACYVRDILVARGWHRVLLVTSASHMRRAVAVFQAQDVDVIAAPTDVRVVDRDFSLWQLLPSVSGLEKSSIATKEYIGWWVYRLRGWIE